MSRATQLAKAEADAIEAEDTAEPDDDDDAEAAAEATAEPDDDDGASLQASLKAFEKENERHATELASIMGEDFAAMVACENCGSVGYRPADPYKRDPNLATCEACDGYGILVTGSLNPDKAVQPCMTCGGNGFVTRPVAVPPTPVAAPVVMYDPYTGLPVTVSTSGSTAPPSPNNEWAPGYTPPPQPRPSGL